MLKTVTHVGLGVNDQDEALAFWTEKIGFEVRNDVTLEEMGGFRWLTVGPPSQPDLEILLLPPGRPGTPPDVVEKAREALSYGVLPALIFQAEDAQATYEELKSRGVEFTQATPEQQYAIDAGF